MGTGQGSDVADAWGLMSGNPTALVASATMDLPPANYSAGATVFASFSTTHPSGAYEVNTRARSAVRAWPCRV